MAGVVRTLVDVPENFFSDEALRAEKKRWNGNLDFPVNIFLVKNGSLYRAQDPGVLRRKEFPPVEPVPAAGRITASLARKLEIDIFLFGIECADEQFDAAVFPGVFPVLVDVCRETFLRFGYLETEMQKMMVFLDVEDDGRKFVFIFIRPKSVRN